LFHQGAAKNAFSVLQKTHFVSSSCYEKRIFGAAKNAFCFIKLLRKTHFHGCKKRILLGYYRVNIISVKRLS